MSLVSHSDFCFELWCSLGFYVVILVIMIITTAMIFLLYYLFQGHNSKRLFSQKADGHPSGTCPQQSIHPSIQPENIISQPFVFFIYWFWSNGQSTFMSSLWVQCLKLKQIFVTQVCNGNLKWHFWQLTLVCGAAGFDGEDSVFLEGASRMSHDEPGADSSWWAIDLPLGSPPGHPSASLARA